MYKLQKDICIGCGACSYICPNSSIKLVIDKMGKIVPVINDNSCINCYKCSDICINNILNNARNYKDLTNKKLLIGDIITSYVAWSKNDGIRSSSTSGGFVTTLLYELLKSKTVDYVSIIQHDPSSNKQAKMKVSSSIDDVTKSRGSKYIAVDISETINHIVSNNSCKYAIVGLPCHFAAIKNVLNEKRINKDNIYFIGLMCSKTLNYGIFNYFKKTITANENIDDINYRYKINGAPGDVFLKAGGKEYIIPFSHRRQLNNYYKNFRCLQCADQYNVFSDITVGDCFINKYKTNKGESTVLIRSSLGQYLFNLIKDEISYIETDKENLIRIKENSPRLLYAQYKGNFPNNNLKKYSIKLNLKKKFEILRVYIGYFTPKKLLSRHIKKKIRKEEGTE